MSPSAFRHEAFLYADEAEFLEGTVPFISEAVEQRAPVLVAVGARKIAALKSVLDGDADGVQFADMAILGRNPARIIPAWQAFVEEHGGDGRHVRGIGEPIWAGRSPDELVECLQHEALLNLAFGDVSGLWLLCPYDTSSLDAQVIEQAQGTHPFVHDRIASWLSPGYEAVQPAGLLAEPLPPPPVDAIVHCFGHELAPVRRLAKSQAVEAGWEDKAADVALVAGELATNTVRHGGGDGTLRIWCEGETLICEVSDGGQLVDAMVGRRRPLEDQIGGRGLWLTNQVCDLVQVRSTPAGTIVRVHITSS